MKRYIAALLLACCVEGYAQEKKQAAFVPPFDFPLTLSGNFGEIRSNHFHGGLDFKTGGTIGKPVRALADGYISRIRVTNGSGYVLDVCYHNGYSTINRHLSAFLSPIAERVKKLQYEKIEGLREYYEEGCGPFDTPQYIEELSKIHSYVDRLIAIFLPKFSIKPEP